MPAQIDYYNRFGEEFKDAILACPEPHLWTTDYAERGRVYREMKARIDVQDSFVQKHFLEARPVLDVGCGFGRQAFLLAKKGFAVTGTDTSEVFIDIAVALFARHGLAGQFFCVDILKQLPAQTFGQVLLLDVLEHIPPWQRKTFLASICKLMETKGILLLSLPHVKKRPTSQLNNRVRKVVTQHIGWFRNLEEHPYPVPQEKSIVRMTETYFGLLEFLSTRHTDYYVLQKR